MNHSQQITSTALMVFNVLPRLTYFYLKATLMNTASEARDSCLLSETKMLMTIKYSRTCMPINIMYCMKIFVKNIENVFDNG